LTKKGGDIGYRRVLFASLCNDFIELLKDVFIHEAILGGF
jgi:hypothetical protein